MQEGYESRHVAYSLFKHAMMAVASDENLSTCARGVMLQMAYNALPVTEVCGSYECLLSVRVIVLSVLVVCKE